MAVSGYALYEDTRQRVLRLKKVGPGAVVEYRYKTRQTEPRLFRQGMRFGMSYPVRRAVFRVVAPAGWKVEHATVRLNERVEWAPLVSESGGLRSLTWEREGLEAVPAETRAPGFWARVPVVHVRLAEWTEEGRQRRAFSDYPEFSRWLHELNAPQLRSSEEIVSVTAEVLEGVPDEPRAKARALYNWVRRSVRYCAIEIGIGGWRAHPSDKVMDLRYGDCKDKANLLRAMLAQVGIESQLAGLYSHDGFPRERVMPTIGDTNHAILRVDLPEGPVFVDPTTRVVPFGALPTGDQGAPILAYTEAGDELVRTYVASPEQNSREEIYAFALSPDGEASGSYELRALGEHAHHLRRALLERPKDEWSELLDERLWLDSKKADAPDRVDGVDPDTIRKPLVVKGQLIMRRALGGTGQTRLVRPSDLWWSWVPRLPTMERESPILHSCRERSVQRLVLTLPAGYEVASVPDPVSLAGPYGAYELSWSADGRRVVLERRQEQTALVVPAAEYGELKRFYDEILAAEDRPAVLSGVSR